MRKMNLAEGTLVLLGFIFTLVAVIFKISGLNLLEQISSSGTNLLLIANICFIVAFVVTIFGAEEK